MREKIVQQPKDDFANVDFGDKRLNKRLQQVVEDSTKDAEKSILGSAGGWSDAKAFVTTHLYKLAKESIKLKSRIAP